ncbi:MAG: CDP-diacylglycerol--glycerol-3-phosphate 3-phosphatidyltransferase [Clostridia bacterium]
MLKKMNLANKITMLRIILVPFFVIFMALPTELIWTKWVAFVIFVVASLSDFVDGYIARKYNLITKFGKVMDPLADKLLVSSGFVMLTGLGVIPAWITAIVLFRDFFVSSLRMFGSDNGSDVSANLSGKLKTIFVLIGISLGIMSIALFKNVSFCSFITGAFNMSTFALVINILMSVSICLATITTLWSIVDYFFKFKKDINVEE